MSKQILLQILHRSGVLPSRKDMSATRESMIASDNRSETGRDLLRSVSIDISRNDGMYIPGNAEHYLSVGLSAIEAIDLSLAAATRNSSISKVLDFPCGYGRVTRFLKVRFPGAEMFGSELRPSALEFCQQKFGMLKIESQKDFLRIEVPCDFDVIWCGSLITHLDRSNTERLLEFFHSCLAGDGVCIFTTHGNKTLEMLQTGQHTYNLDARSRAELLRQYEEDGYGFGRYRLSSDYGISVVRRDQMREILSLGGRLREILFLERGWDNHQDVFAVQKKA